MMMWGINVTEQRESEIKLQAHLQEKEQENQVWRGFVLLLFWSPSDED